MIYLYALANLMIVIIGKAFYNKWQFNKGITISHPIQWLFVALLSSPSIYLLGREGENWYVYPIVAVVCMAFFWLCFDIVLNKIRRKKATYAGVITKNSSWWDKVLIKLTPFWRIAVKVILLIFSIGAYMLTL